MGNKWRNDDFNRWDEEEARRSRPASGRYDEPRQFSQDAGSSQYGNETDYRTDRDWQRGSRERMRRNAPDMERSFESQSYAQPGTFYYGGQPQRQFGLGPAEPAFEGDNAPDAYGRNTGRSGGYSSGNVDAAYRNMAAFERETAYAHDHDNESQDRADSQSRSARRGGGMFNDDPNKGPINRLRNWMSHSGKGPKGYKRSDERIRDDVNDHLTHDHGVDATHIDVVVVDCECTLSGNVATRDEKRRAEDIAERIMGVKHVQNNLRVGPTATSALSSQDRTGTMSTTVGSNPTLSASRGSSNT
jgi:osmotically-inducible protein OsmY